MAPTCSTCRSALVHITGGTVISLYRCSTCHGQLMLPGNGLADAPALSPTVAPPSPAVVEKVEKIEKKGWLSRIFGG